MSVPQRFLANSVRGAMAEAKRALGPEALIIEHRLVNGRVELIAMSGGSAESPVAAVADTVSEPTDRGQVSVDPSGASSSAPDAADVSLVEEIELALPSVPESASSTAAIREPGAEPMAAPRADRSASPLASTPAAGSTDAVAAAAARCVSTGPAAAAARNAIGDVDRVLQAMGFTSAIRSLLSEQAVTPRLAINELLAHCRFSTWSRSSGVMPVIGGSGAGVTTSLLRLALELRSHQPRLRLQSANSDTLAGSEKLLLGAQLLKLHGSRLSADALTAAVSEQVPAELSLLDLSTGSYSLYIAGLRRLQQQGLLDQLVLVVPLHWQPAVYLHEIASVDLLWDRSCRVHVVFTGADRCDRIAPWLELALRNDWSLSLLSASGQLGTPAEAASPAVLRRLLRPQIDRPEASTIFTEELLRERGA